MGLGFVLRILPRRMTGRLPNRETHVHLPGRGSHIRVAKSIHRIPICVRRVHGTKRKCRDLTKQRTAVVSVRPHTSGGNAQALLDVYITGRNCSVDTGTAIESVTFAFASGVAP